MSFEPNKEITIESEEFPDVVMSAFECRTVRITQAGENGEVGFVLMCKLQATALRDWLNVVLDSTE